MGNPTTTRRPLEQRRSERLAAAYGVPVRSSSLDTADHTPAAEGSGLPLIAPHDRIAKRVFDIVGAAVGLAVLAPLLLLIAAALLVSGQLPIFVHRRLGRSGQLFPCLKFQTMHRDAEERLLRLLASDEDARHEWTTHQKLANDPRVTRIGRFLRRTNLDELPQLANVFVGHMSLVGPRPIVAAEQARYGPAFPAVSRVRPGLTGLWQISGRNLLSYERRVQLDVDYVSSCSMRTDVGIIARTIGQTVLTLLGSRRFGGV